MKRKHPLRRIMIGVAATASGVVLLLALKQPGGTSVAGATATARAGGGVSASAGASVPDGAPPAGAGAPSGTATDAATDAGTQPETDAGTGAGSGTGTGAGTGADSGSGAGARTVLGDAVDTQYGPVQVQITVSGGRITKAETVQIPGGSISANAVPRLNEAAVTAQNARIDAVSGASYTSQGYQDSLQSALDKAGV
ncbi:FMN-binding protein [Streptomyces sp. NPDC059568]|uniref:FMN-binding protein n=1 Tax=Streptomyces sp. NPDC059568 TaxID=3346868 RepID=UPI00369E6235